jgi:hypothetical protein
MKATYLLGLLVVMSYMSLIGCSDKDKCDAACQQQRAAMMAANMTAQQRQALVNMVDGSKGNVNLPPGVNPGTSPWYAGLNAPPAGGVVAPVFGKANVSDKEISARAALVSQAIKATSANPMSSYYDDPNGQVIPPRPTNSGAGSVAAVAAVQASASRAPASESSGESSTTH